MMRDILKELANSKNISVKFYHSYCPKSPFNERVLFGFIFFRKKRSRFWSVQYNSWKDVSCSSKITTEELIKELKEYLSDPFIEISTFDIGLRIIKEAVSLCGACRGNENNCKYNSE